MNAARSFIQFLRHTLNKLASRQSSGQAGFTIIELLIVFSITIVMSTMSIVAYSSYTNTQKLSTAAQEIVLVLQKTKYRTQNQIKPSTTPVCTTIKAYEVRFCDETPTCIDPDIDADYEIIAICTNGAINAESFLFPPGVRLDTLNTTTGIVRFEMYTGGISGAGNITVNLEATPEKKRTVTVTNTGIVQLQ